MKNKVFKNILIGLACSLPIMSCSIGMVSCSDTSHQNKTPVQSNPTPPNIGEDVAQTTETNLNLGDETNVLKLITSNDSNGKTLTIPNNFITLSGVLSEHDITNIVIEGDVTTLPSNCFSGLSKLASITFNRKSLKIIGDGTFAGCSALSIQIPSSVTTIGNNSFADVSSVTFESDSKLRTIGNYAFANAKFSTISLPDKVSSLGESAFYNCENLTSFSFPSKINVVNNSLFNNCRKLNSITFTNNILGIGSWAFNNCIALTSINLPKNLELISEFAFAYCTKLTTIVIPNSLRLIGGLVFIGCSSLNNITMSNGFNQSELSPIGPNYQKQLGLTKKQWGNINWVN